MNNIFQTDYVSRRKFIVNSGIVTGLSLSGLAGAHNQETGNDEKGRGMSITIKNVGSNFEREPLIRPFGFKGGYMSEIWQTAARMESTSGVSKTGICTQSVLCSWAAFAIFRVILSVLAIAFKAMALYPI